MLSCNSIGIWICYRVTLKAAAVSLFEKSSYSSDQIKILKDQCAQTTARVVSVAYRLRLPFLINKALNLTKLKSVIYSQSTYMYIYFVNLVEV